MSQDTLPTVEPRTKRRPNLVFQLLKPLASLQLTIVLFLLSFVLVFAGTIAMTTGGLWSVVDDYFRSFIVWIPFDLFRQFGQVFLLDIAFPKDMSPIKGSFPFPAGWTLGFALLLNLLAAHTVRMKFTWNRTGVIMLHVGMILLMIGELVTGLYAVESMMTLQKGERTNFVDVTDVFELAVTDSRDDKIDRVTVIPEHFLTTPGDIRSDELPFDLRVTEYWPNTAYEFVDNATKGDTVLAFNSSNTGSGTLAFKQAAISVGVNPESRSDMPSLKLEVLEKGTDTVLQSHFLSVFFYQNNNENRRTFIFPPQRVTLDGKGYDLTLRNKRIYKPYSVELLQFEHGVYPGTEIPKDFASEVILRPQDSDEERTARIWMNNPLSYDGDSMYQFAYLHGDDGTILQVVRNPGAIIPYISCTMVTLGMLIHFLMRMTKWLKRSPTVRRDTSSPIKKRFNPLNTGPMPTWQVILPWAILAIFTIWLGSKTIPPKPTPDGIDYNAIGELPVREAGRVMPLSTLARTNLQYISGLTEVKNTDKKVVASGMEWLTALLSERDPRTGKSRNYTIFRIEHPQLLGLLELPERPEFYRYSMDEIGQKFSEFNKEYERVNNKLKADEKIDVYENAVNELGRKIAAYGRLSGATAIEIVPTSDGNDWQTMRQIDNEVKQTLTDDDEKEVQAKSFDRLKTFIQAKFGKPIDEIPKENIPLIQRILFEELIPESRNEYAEAHRERVSPAAATLTQLLNAATAGQGEKFDTLLSEYQNKYLTKVPESELWNTRVESYFLNHLEPFHYCFVMYLVVIVVSLCSFLFLRAAMWQTAMLLTGLTFAIHTMGLLTRMLVMDRPPVTNLYASAVFIGFGAVLLCLILEWLYKNGLGLLTAGFVGAATAYVAKFLAADGDTMEKLRAVLDTNFWLAVHVTTVTLGYTATFVGGMLGCFWIIRSVFTPNFTEAESKEVTTMMYGVICFATLLSFFGTVSGGIWADYSWGRFWGWDPKENGAVLIVIWNALILHARWAGLVKGRGIAILAVLGNMVVAWSWFGTNQLQIGLHSYGFSSKLASGCFWFWVSQAIVIGFAIVPRNAWISVNPPSWAKSEPESPLSQAKRDERSQPPMARKSRRRQG